MIAEHDLGEYADFVYAIWPTRSAWRRVDLGADDLLLRQAKRYFWRENRAAIELALKFWQDRGWVPVERVGPDAIKLTKIIGQRTGLDPVRLLFWCLTLGIVLLLDLLFPSPITYITYEPVEFRVRMCRAKAIEWMRRAAA